jgi:hypothetical protein
MSNKMNIILRFTVQKKNSNDRKVGFTKKEDFYSSSRKERGQRT